MQISLFRLKPNAWLKSIFYFRPKPNVVVSKIPVYKLAGLCEQHCVVTAESWPSCCSRIGL